MILVIPPTAIAPPKIGWPGKPFPSCQLRFRSVRFCPTPPSKRSLATWTLARAVGTQSGTPTIRSI